LEISEFPTPYTIALLNNLAATNLQENLLHHCLENCEQVLQLDRQNTIALLRRVGFLFCFVLFFIYLLILSFFLFRF